MIDLLSLIEIKQIDVFNELWNIKLNASVGPDGISAYAKCACVLTPIITSLFNKSLILVNWGVPQGDLLSPLFSLFINDLSKAIIHSNILLFADDTKIFKVIKNLKDIEGLQIDLNNIHDWCIKNKL